MKLTISNQGKDKGIVNLKEKELPKLRMNLRTYMEDLGIKKCQFKLEGEAELL